VKPPSEDVLLFEPWDFEALSPAHAKDPELNERRLAARRRLDALAKAVVERGKASGLALESRTSLHHPHAFNGGAVRRLWAYVTRGKKQKARLARVLGAELGRDLDAAYRNAYLCLALEHEALEASLRIHPEGWYDGQNMLQRLAAEGQGPLLGRLRELEGFRLRIDDWKGEWRAGPSLEPERLAEFFRYYKPGEHRFAIERRWPAPAGAREAVLAPGVAASLVGEVTRLFDVYRWIAWSEESDFLFAR